MTWPTRRLGDLMEFRNGLSYSAADRGEGLAIVGVADVSRGGRLPTAGFETIRTPSNLPEAALLRPGDLLFVRSNGSKDLVGRCAEVGQLDQPTSHSGFTIRARVIDPDVNPKWVAAFFACGLGDAALGRGARGTNINNLRQERLQGIVIPCPPRETQDRTICVYERFQDLASLYDSAIRCRNQQTDGLKQGLLCGTVRFPGSLTAWPTVRLCDVAEVDPATQFSCGSECPISFVPMADINEEGERIGSGEKPASSVTCGYSAFVDNDILVAKITPCFENGKAWLATSLKNSGGVGSTEFYVIRCGKDCLPDYLWLHLTSQPFRRRGAANMTGSAGQKRVPKAFVRNFEFPLPSLHEQKRICGVFRHLRNSIRDIRSQRARYSVLERAVLQEAISGGVM